MKLNIFVVGALAIIFYAGYASLTPLLGTKLCTRGPSYWCQNLTSASSCHAVKHCIQTVWEHQTAEPDNDSVCQICIQMVTEARDQLESNETQEELKEVFEGSCNLIPLKVISKECCKLVDDFIPDLVDTLASQMNPQMVCTVAGLCNNKRIDKMLAEQEAKEKSTTIDLSKDINVNKNKIDCQSCRTIGSKIESKFAALNENEVLESMLKVCGRMGSFSDSCSNIVISYFEEIYGTLKQDLNSDAICHVSGLCSDMFHQHPSVETAVEIIPHGSIGVRPITDDLPCDLCSQLVGHLRDILIANTTEEEFEKVLQGICKQMNSFKQECLNIVDEYYPMIYQFLTKELDAREVCVMARLCPGPGLESDEPLWPLLPVETAKKLETLVAKFATTEAPKLSKLEIQNAQLPVERILTPETLPNIQSIIGSDEANSYKQKEPVLTNLEIQNAQLPIDRILPNSLLGVHNSEICTLCEYILHYIQVEITDMKNEEEIKQAVEHVCDELPNSIGSECVGFIETYGDAIISLLAQAIDPSELCPMLSLCPKQDMKDVEVLMHTEYKDKSNCPLCLFAVEQLENMVKKEKSEENIKKALDKLCSYLPQDLVSECNDFVSTYSKELVEMLIADLNPQEVCVYLRLCDPKAADGPSKSHSWAQNDIDNGGDILTNEIPDITVGGQFITDSKLNGVDDVKGPQCVFCKMIVEQVLIALNGSIKADDIKHAFHKACSACPEKEECNAFVSKYIDQLIDLISNHLTPGDICSVLFLCTEDVFEMKSEITNCIICEEIAGVLHLMLKNPNVDHNIDHLLKKACHVLPQKDVHKCQVLMNIYGKSLIDLLERETNHATVCKKLQLCSSNDAFVKVIKKSKKVGAAKCTWGPSYWCQHTNSANECNALKYCQDKVWMKEAP